MISSWTFNSFVFQLEFKTNKFKETTIKMVYCTNEMRSCKLSLRSAFFLLIIMHHLWSYTVQQTPLVNWILRYGQLKGYKNSIKGTNGRQTTYEIFHVYCIFYSFFTCQTTVIFGITKEGSLVLNTFASWNCFTCRNLFQNGANDSQNV